MFENNQPVDIFEKIDAPAEVLPQGVPSVPELPNPAPRRWLLAGSIGFVLAVLIGGGTWAYSFFNAPKKEPVPVAPEIAMPVVPVVPVVPETEPAAVPEIPTAPVERCVNGNFAVFSPLSADDTGDADGDGLFDYQESVTYGSNPCSVDGDTDGYPDFAEACNGYNPAGAGKLPEGVSIPASCPVALPSGTN